MEQNNHPDRATAQTAAAGEAPRRTLNPEERARFQYHGMSEPQQQASNAVRYAITEAAIVAGALPPGRDRALVLTKLEEALFHANACIARNPAAF